MINDKIKYYLFCGAVDVILWSMTSSFCHGEETSITVTANKLEQNIVDVPSSLSVFSGEELKLDGTDSVDELSKKIPSFSFQATGQSGFNPPVVRGLTSYATAFSSSMMMLVDGIPTLTNQGFENSFVGIDRVEILRGPQSALYGKNAEGGVLNIYTHQPGNMPYGLIEGELGSRNKHVFRFDASHPLIKNTLYFGIAGQLYEQDGFINNNFSDKKEDNRKNFDGRLVLRWTPDEKTDISLYYSQLRYHDGGSQWGGANSPRYEVNSATPSWNRSQDRAFSLAVEHKFDSDITLHSITAKNDYYDRLKQDTDFTPAERLFMQRNYHLNTLSQEIRLSGKKNNADWLLGIYADKTDNNLLFINKTPIAYQNIKSKLAANSVSLFGQWLQPINSQWTFSVGGRLEQDQSKIQAKPSSSQHQEWQEFSPMVSLQYQWRPEQNLYTSYSKGVRAGGFNPFLPSKGYPSFSPEKVYSYEVGAKGNIKNLNYSVAAYYMQIKDMQVQQYISPGVVSITNAATASSSGLETSLDYWLNTAWSINGSMGFNKTRFIHYRDGSNNYYKNNNPYAPDITWHLGLHYDNDNWYARASLDGVSSIYIDPANKYSRKGYRLVNLAAGYSLNKNTVISSYINNVTNKHYDEVGTMNGSVTVYSPPRELGVKLSYEF